MNKNNFIKKGLERKFSLSTILIDEKDLSKVEDLLEENNIEHTEIEPYDAYIIERTIKKFRNLANYDKIDSEKLSELVEEMADIVENGYFNQYGEYPDLEENRKRFIKNNKDIFTNYDEEEDGFEW